LTIDLHGYHPAEIVWSGVLKKIIQQSWEMGEQDLFLIHGHGRNRGITPGFVNTNTGFFGLQIRRALRHDESLRQWIRHTTLNCEDMGVTSVRLKPNRAPSRTALDPDLISDAAVESDPRAILDERIGGEKPIGGSPTFGADATIPDNAAIRH
jgi:hypothetical protein